MELDQEWAVVWAKSGKCPTWPGLWTNVAASSGNGDDCGPPAGCSCSAQVWSQLQRQKPQSGDPQLVHFFPGTYGWCYRADISQFEPGTASRALLAKAHGRKAVQMAERHWHDLQTTSGGTNAAPHRAHRGRRLPKRRKESDGISSGTADQVMMRLEGSRRPRSPQRGEWSVSVGQRLEVWWSHDRRWYAATALECAAPDLAVWRVEYDDGTITFERLGGQQTRPIEAPVRRRPCKPPTHSIPPQQEAATATTETAEITFPAGCTSEQRDDIEANPRGLKARFGLVGIPENTWTVRTRGHASSEKEWCARGIDDTKRKTFAQLGGLSKFSEYYGKGIAQAHSDFKATVAQRVLTTFRLARQEEWWLDISCGGGTRQLVSAYCGWSSLGIDLRPECVAECREIAASCTFNGAAEFCVGDMVNTEQVVKQWRKERAAAYATQANSAAMSPPSVRFGGLFTSIPFWKLETYDPQHKQPQLLEHCTSFQKYLQALRQSLRSAVACLERNSWLLIHTGPLRYRQAGDSHPVSRLCDIPFEVKKILSEIPQVIIEDEVVMVPPLGNKPMVASALFASRNRLVNTNTRLIVAWYGELAALPRHDHLTRPVPNPSSSASSAPPPTQPSQRPVQHREHAPPTTSTAVAAASMDPSSKCTKMPGKVVVSCPHPPITRQVVDGADILFQVHLDAFDAHSDERIQWFIGTVRHLACMCMYVSATPKNCYAAIFRPTKQGKRKAHGSMASPHVLKTGGLSKFITAAGSTCGTRKKKSRTKFYCQLQAKTSAGFSSMVPQHPRSKDVTSGGRVVATSKFCGTTTIAGIERRCPCTQRHWS